MVSKLLMEALTRKKAFSGLSRSYSVMSAARCCGSLCCKEGPAPKVATVLEQFSGDLMTFTGWRSDFPLNRIKNSNVEN